MDTDRLGEFWTCVRNQGYDGRVADWAQVVTDVFDENRSLGKSTGRGSQKLVNGQIVHC
jgi:hypothetical protein